MEEWKDLLESGNDIHVELMLWLQEQTITNIYKVCDEMNLAEFILLHDVVNTTSNGLLINYIGKTFLIFFYLKSKKLRNQLPH